jgi:putative ABC transport system substrate-binding protein
MSSSRRSIILGLACLAFATPARPSPHVPGTMRRLGVMYLPSRAVVESVPYDPAPLAAFGWVEGKTFEKVKRYADGDASRFDALARELVAERVDVLLTAGVPGTRAMQAATRTIPICAIVDDPVGNGFAKTMAHPGGNITGLCEGYAEMSEKTIELLRAAMPSLSHIAIVSTAYDAPFLVGANQWLIKAAARAGISTDAHFVETRAQIAALVQALPAGRSAIYLRWTRGKDARLIAQAAAARRIAVSGQEEELVDDGALMTFRPIVADDHELAAMLDRLLRGANPAEIPFQLPTKSVFAINRKAAAAIGVTFPEDFAIRASKVK